MFTIGTRILKYGLLKYCMLLLILTASSFASDLDVMSDSDLAQLLQRYQEDHRYIRDFYHLSLSKSNQERIQQFQNTWVKRVSEIDFDGLNQSGKIDYLLFKNHLDYVEQQNQFQKILDDDVLTLLPFSDDIFSLELARWKIESITPEETAAKLSAIIEMIEQTQEQVKKGLESSESDEEGEDKKEGLKDDDLVPIDTTDVIANRAIREFHELKRTLRNWFDHYDQYHPEFHWWVSNVFDETMDALDGYSDFLRDEVAGYEDGEDAPLIGDPIGKDRLLTDLRHEMVPYTPEELIEIANQEFAWCENEMNKASHELGFGDDWHAALEHIKNLHADLGEQDALVYRQSVEAIQFLEERNLITIPELCRESWRLEMISKEVQKVNPYAFYGGQYMGVSFPTMDMPPASKKMSMRGNNIHFSRIVTPHELIPGHHLQKFMASRYNPHRRQFWTPFLVEGWALYWEMLLWDLDYPRGPEDRIGMLFWRMHRCARIIVSLKFHLNEMKPQEMIDFLVDRVGHERDGATSEVRRFIGGNYSPLYQCAYMLGGLQIRAMRRELVDTGKLTNREFHDAILKENEMPIALIRAKLMELELEAGAYPEWRFYQQ